MQENVTASKSLYKGKFLEFIEDEIEILTDPIIKSRRQYILHPGGVCMVPLLDDNTLVLVKQYRSPIQELIYEIPAGKIDPGEDKFSTAKRELQEETGYTANTWTDLGKLYPCPGYSNENLYIYLARDLKPGKQNLDHGEVIETFTISIEDAIEQIHSGDIRDAKTVSGIFMAQKYINS